MMTSIAPLPIPPPALPPGEPFTDPQWDMLLSIMDTVIPSIRHETAPAANSNISQWTIPDDSYNAAADYIQNTVTNPPDNETLEEYLGESVSGNPEFLALLKRTLVCYARADGKKGLALVLSALSTRVGSYLLTGYITPFNAQPIIIRTAILNSWRTAYTPTLQVLYKTFTSLAKNLWIKTSPTFYPIVGFPPVPDHYEPSPHYEYEFVQFANGEGPEVIETDVVIVGSGCGGAVSAKNLAEAGHKVLVVEKSYYFPPSALPMSEAAAGIHLYENGGSESSDDASITVISGSTWGGGGTVNWSASLQPQEFVRKEWAEDRGLEFFKSQDFQDCLDRVCNRMGVGDSAIRHNHGNQMILEGARKLGYTAKPVPQNTAGNEHYCGYCTLGCGSAQKQGPAISWLPDAARAGARFAEGFKVDRVLFDDSQTAIGVTGTWTSRNPAGGVDGPASDRIVREVIVKAKKVIISSGSLWSPIILLNSGLTNPQIGQHLYLHPVGIIAAVYPRDVRPWEGGMLTSVATSFENLDSHGHGVKLETPCMLPSWSLSILPWTSGLDFKLHALKYRHTNGFIALTRERDPGSVYQDPTSKAPRIKYTPSPYDRAHTLTGMIALARMAHTTGATEIHALIAGHKPFLRTATSTDADFSTWLDGLQSHGNNPPAAIFISAHQMGTNRMSTHPQHGVVDPQGRVWGSHGLFVADASVFPSASGVNPMVTNMAISDWISRGVGRELKKESERETGAKL